MAPEIVVPISEVRRRAAGLVRRAAAEQRPILIARRGRATAVLRDVRSYNRERERMAMLILVMQGERDIREGRVLSHAEARRRIDALLLRARAKPR